MSDDSRIREGHDDFGKFWEEETGRGWRKLRRWIEGKKFNVYAPKTRDYLTAIEASGIILRLNDMSDRIELAAGRPISDFDEAEIMGRLKDYGMPNAERMREAIKIMANRNRYHPVKEYMESLKWDGRDHFSAFISKLGMASPGALTINLNFDPAVVSHQELWDLFENDAVRKFAIGFSDGAKTIVPTFDSSGAAVFPTTRSFVEFEGYVADLPLEFALNGVVTSAVSIQRTGARIPHWKTP
jgi:hypothetical protein